MEKMENADFRKRLKELRENAGLSQRQLANKVGINFSYLSKIESGTMPPPSEQVIIKLAEALDADRDELLILAGNIPPDIARMLKNKETLQILRSNIEKEKRKRKEAGNMSKSSVYKALSKIAVPVVLVLAVATSLWFASPLPARALDIDITPPPTGTHGSVHSFTVTVDLNSAEHIPIQSIDMTIYNVANPSSYTMTCSALPLTPGQSKSYNSSAGSATVTAASASDNWKYTTDTGYANWQGTGYSWGSVAGYGYSTGSAQITYTGRWTSPSSWPSGSYQVKVVVSTSSSTPANQGFSQTSNSFRLNAEEAAVVSGGGSAFVASPGTYNVADIITAGGQFTNRIVMRSQDRNVKLDIAQNVIGKKKNGAPLETITILPMEKNPDPPAGGKVLGLSYDFQPDGATFEPAIPVTFSYDPDSVTDINDLKIAIWDDINKEWIPLDNCVVDTVNHTITGYASHFTVFGLVELGPAEEEVIEEEEEEVVEEEEEEVVEEEEEEVVEEEEEEVVEEEEEEAVEEEEEEVVTPTTGIAWWVWVIIAAAIVAVLLLVYFLWWKRRLA